jgi:hypothetical protein
MPLAWVDKVLLGGELEVGRVVAGGSGFPPGFSRGLDVTD